MLCSNPDGIKTWSNVIAKQHCTKYSNVMQQQRHFFFFCENVCNNVNPLTVITLNIFYHH